MVIIDLNGKAYVGKKVHPSGQKVLKLRRETSWAVFSKCDVQIKVSPQTQLSRTKPDPDQTKAGPNQSTEHMSFTTATPKLIFPVFMRILLGPYKSQKKPSRNKQEMYMIFPQSFSP